MENIFFDIAIIITAASVLGFLARLARQPLVPSYILAGILLGPLGLKLVRNPDTIFTLSEIGIAFLLFVVGIEFSLKKLKDVGLYASVGGTIQITVLFGLGFLSATLFGTFSGNEALYLGFMLAFSSTMVVIKLLADKEELDTLHGHLIIGVLLIEDVFAILAMSALTTLDSFSPLFFVFAIVKGLALFALAILAGRYVFPKLFSLAAKSQEVLFLLSLTVCFVFAIIARELGFSIVVGAFLAGVSLANLPFNLEIVARVKPLRDFFSTLFFATLGMALAPSTLSRIIAPLVVFVFIVVAAKPLLITAIAKAFNYSRRTSLLTGINLAQTSEFSLIIVAQGLALGHIGKDIFTLAVILATVTMTLTAYLIKYDSRISSAASKRLGFLDSFGNSSRELTNTNPARHFDVILIGYDRIAYSISRKLKHMGKSCLVVDFNPDIIRKLIREKTPCIYGDIGDAEFLDKLNLREVDLVISTAPDPYDNALLIKKVKSRNPRAAIFVTANRIEEALELYDEGADYVILPHLLGGDHVSLLLEDITKDISKLLRTKIEHIEELRDRHRHGHHHRRDLPRM